MTTTHKAGSSMQKKSFASVAAAAVPSSRRHPAAGRADPNASLRSQSSTVNPSQASSISEKNSMSQMQNAIHNSISKLSIKDPPVTSLTEDAKSNIKRAGLNVDDNNTHISNSTNTNSLDGKSTASGTTFAFDEKESLRPDDSASVQAVDDDEVASGLCSIAPSSRLGSEAGGRAFQGQFTEVSAIMPAGPVRLQSPPQAVSLELGDNENASKAEKGVEGPISIQTTHSMDSLQRRPMSFVDVQPDEKLFEALDSPKDRLFLLRLEKLVVDFIQSADKLPSIQLPPCNSFCRLLAHKLADYYGLTHFFDGSQNAVNLFRTPYCRSRTPISEVPRSEGQVPVISPVVAIPTMKIMRRPDLNKDGQTQGSATGTTESSVVASKAGSENGDDNAQGTGATSPTESTLAKEKQGALTLAERSERYKIKREQLFGPQTENNEISEVANGISRVSSRNEKKSAKKKSRPTNDDFEGRSEYFATMNYAQRPHSQGHNHPGFFVPYGLQMPMSHTMTGNGFHPGMQEQGFPPTIYGSMTNQGCSTMNAHAQTHMGFNNHMGYPSYDQQPQGQYLAVSQQPPVFNQVYPALSSPSMDGNFHPSAEMHLSRNAQSHYFNAQDYSGQQHYQPYPTFPVNNLPQQHGFMATHSPNSLPNGFAQSHTAFNPQTRSFIPNGTTKTHPGHQSTGTTIAMSNSSPSKTYTGGNQLPPVPSSQSPFGISKENARSQPNRKHLPHINGSNSSSTSSLAKWAAPATLPAKPPPPDAPMMHESLPVNGQSNLKTRTMIAGQTPPHFHNGVYSITGGR